MKLRNYIEETDFPFVQSWMEDERSHALWCAGQFAYPLDRDNFREALRKNALEWKSCPYVVTEDGKRPTGFLACNVNREEHYAFLSFLILDPAIRGKGYGIRMVESIAEALFEEDDISALRLNVFDVNEAAVRCYQRAGFLEESRTLNAFTFRGETWGRRCMVRERKEIAAPGS